MNILRASSQVADVAWNVVRSINRSLPEGRLPMPAWSDTPLKRKRERTFPPLGPRWTQSVCPKCLLEIRSSILHNDLSERALTDDTAVIEAQVLEEAGTGGSDHWSAQLYDHDRWGIMFIGGMWFQDLFDYELPNLQTSTAVVADAGLDPAIRASTEVAFSFKNAGGWRQIVEAARCAPSLSKWHKENGRHAIYSNHQFVPIGEVRSAPNAGSSPIPSIGDAEELADVLG
jgi:hypothetical protein